MDSFDHSQKCNLFILIGEERNAPIFQRDIAGQAKVLIGLHTRWEDIEVAMTGLASECELKCAYRIWCEDGSDRRFERTKEGLRVYLNSDR